MALTYCPDCNHQVSDRAATCPVCAAPLQDKGKQIAPIGVLATLGIIAAVLIIYFILTWNPNRM